MLNVILVVIETIIESLSPLSPSILALQNKKERKSRKCCRARMQSVQQRSEPSVGGARAGRMSVSCKPP